MVRVFIFIFSLIFNAAGFCADCAPIKKASEAEGGWKREIILGRDAISADKNGTSSRIWFDVPAEGGYQFYAYVYQNWRRDSPFIYVEAEDSLGKKHYGYMFFEPCWYLKREDPGRWLMHSPVTAPSWRLPRGKVSLTFSVYGRKSMWSREEVPMEGKVAVEHFFLIPVIGGNEAVSTALLEPEFFFSAVKAEPYDGRYGCGIIVSAEPGDLSTADIIVPSGGTYLVFVSMRMGGGGSVELSLEPGGYRFVLKAGEVQKEPIWRGEMFGPFDLKQGEYRLTFKNISEVTGPGAMVEADYFWLVPCRVNGK